MVFKMHSGNRFSLVFIIVFFVSRTKEVQLPDDDRPLKSSSSKSGGLDVCLKPQRASNELVTCFGHQMLKKMQDLEEKEEFSLADGIQMKRDEGGPRDISNFLDKDPKDYRAILEGASALMGRRALQWDMTYLHPGLSLRIGPTLANGVLEFVMDPRIRDRESIDQEPSTARLLTRQLLIPFLLGFKFQLSTLLPLLFGIMVILSKKALILAKIAVVASSVFGYNSLFSGNNGYLPGGGGYYGGTGPGLEPRSEGLTLKHHNRTIGRVKTAPKRKLYRLSAYGNRYHSGNDYFLKNNGDANHANDHDGVDPYYVSSSNNQHAYDGHVTPEDLRDRLERLFVTKHGHNERAVHSVRNFAWNA